MSRIDSGHEGETIATYPWKTDFANNIATIAVHDNSVVMTSAYNQHSIARLSISRQGVAKVWEQNLASKVCSPVVADGHVYWAWQQVYCLDFETGKLEWKGGACGDPGSCIATADGRLIVWSGRGDLTLVEGAKRSPDRYLELARKTGLSSADVWPHVVLANRRLFCKDREGNILSFALTDG